MTNDDSIDETVLRPRATPDTLPPRDSDWLGVGTDATVVSQAAPVPQREAAVERLRPGSHDGLHLGETLGTGGMGIVHAGRDGRLGRNVAIKTVRPPTPAVQRWPRQQELEAK